MSAPRRLGRRKCLHRRAIVTLFLLGFASLAVETHTAAAQSAPQSSADAIRAFDSEIAEAARRFGLPKQWISAVIQVESAGDPGAISSAGAMGLMQLMPGTWADLRQRHRLGTDPFDPRDNILAGTAYLREMYDRYGSVTAMLAAYNAGPDRYDDFVRTGRTLPAETSAYVARLAPLLGADRLPDTRPAAPSDWREAPLFVERKGRAGAHQSLVASSVPATDQPPDPEPSGDLFVTRNGDGGEP
jgi:soluble lytic murein transglycosylase-like protein